MGSLVSWRPCASHATVTSPCCPTPRARHGADPSEERLVGKPAHSHIFLPRLMVELEAMAPEVLDALAKRGLTFGPGAKGLPRALQ